MKKMTKEAQRKTNGGKLYGCMSAGATGGRPCPYVTPFKWAMGWHYVQMHIGAYKAGLCRCIEF